MRFRDTSLALVLMLAMSVVSPMGSPARANALHDQNVGVWDYTCRVDQVNTYETVTVGGDTSGPLGDVSGFARGLCNAFLRVRPDQFTQGYEMFPRDQPRPGDIVCSYVYRYGGYWQTLRPPYAINRGAAIITIRDTGNDALTSDSSVTYGRADCASIGNQLDGINYQNGFNTTDHPLATFQECSDCGGIGGGGGPSAGFAGTLPTPPKAKKSAKKPLHCVTDSHHKKPTCHR